DPERLAAAWRALVESHPVLRCEVLPDATQRLRACDDPSLAPLLAVPILDLSPEADPEAVLAALRARLSHQILPLDRLIELALTRMPGHWGVHLSLDALILDGESTALLLEELFPRYRGGARPQLPANAPSFRDYVLAPRDTAKALAYWSE